MCGIAGHFLHQADKPKEKMLMAMAQTLEYRGPDDEGLYRAPHIGMVHRRLSIRDLTGAGRCPMSNGTNTIQVVFNGEIYNWRELRLELESCGHAFKTKSDTEVIVAGYEAWGEAVIPRLRGMFAIAVWDGQRKRLLLARDRAGEKPLYYKIDSTGVIFGSTVGAVAAATGRQNINPIAIALYLAHSVIPGPHTVLEGVKVLQPAHMLMVTPREQPVIYPYWEFARVRPARLSRQRCAHIVEVAIQDSVRRCLDADVPVGVFLSGGVDSSLVAAIAARYQPEIPAFSLGFKEKDYSEEPYARQVASHLKIPHYVIQMTVNDLISCLPHLVREYGQPFGDASAVPTFLLARMARQQVKVCLSGDGGDESFGGYWRMQAGVYAARYGAVVPRKVREECVPRVVGKLGTIGKRWEAMNDLSLAHPGAGYTNSDSWLNLLGDLAGPRLEKIEKDELIKARAGGSLDRPEATVIQRILFDDFQVQLPDAYLTKVDVASMAASLEVRAPLLDQDVIEKAWVLPDQMKLHWGKRKWLLKKLAARCIPADVVYRRKMGFAMPLAEWWQGVLGDYLESVLKESIADSEGWIRAKKVYELLREHRGGTDHKTRLWLILWLELWFRSMARESSYGT